MKIKTLFTALMINLCFTYCGFADDINLSWNVKTLQGQALTQTIKQAKLKKYSRKIHLQTEKKTSQIHFVKKTNTKIELAKD